MKEKLMGFRVFGSKNMNGTFIGSVRALQLLGEGSDLPLVGWSRQTMCPCCDRKIVIRVEGEPLSTADKAYLKEMAH